MAKTPTVAFQINDTEQLRVRLNSFKGKDTIMLQKFYKPSEESDRGVDSTGYAFGKAAAIPATPRNAKRLKKAVAQFCDAFLATHGGDEATPKKTKKATPAASEAVEEVE